MEKVLLNEIIDSLTNRMEGYMDDITDCCGDHTLFQGLEMAIAEDRFILDLLVNVVNQLYNDR